MRWFWMLLGSIVLMGVTLALQRWYGWPRSNPYLVIAIVVLLSTTIISLFGFIKRLRE